jgi:type II secretory pathway predicted ATPase ExeA
MVTVMFEQYFNFLRLPFTRDIPEKELYHNPDVEELCSRLFYAARNRLFAVVTGDVGTGKTTVIRKFVTSLDINRYKVMYISDSALTPRAFYWEVLNQLGCEGKFYRSDAKRQLTKEITNLIENQKKTPVIITDEAHLLSREMLEEIRFLLNFKMDSYNPMSLVLVGQSELKDILKKQIYEAIYQRIDLKYHLMSYDRQQTGEYITKHLEYAGETREIFTDMAVNEIYKYSHGVARKINKLCTACLLHAAQIQKKIIDDHMVILIIEEEFNW